MVKKILTLAVSAIFLGTLSCRKQLDVNLNPNVAQTVTPELLLPTAQLAIGSALGVDMNNQGSIWVQYWTQNPAASQYRTLEQYQPTASTYDRVWSLFYSSALPDLRRMEQLAVQSNKKKYQALARILTAYSFQLITDAWGDVPFTEALQGLPANGGVLNPHFDPQARIYDSIISMTRAGMALLDPNDHSTDVADLIYNGDTHKWQLFANTLLLRMYMRLSQRDPAKAQAGIASVFANGIGFLDVGDDAQLVYNTSSGNQNPLAQEVRTLGQNQVASATSADSLNANADSRRFIFYNTLGNVVGLPQGASVGQTGITYTTPGTATGANAAVADDPLGQAASQAPVKFLTSYESYFLQAEAAARGWAPGNAADLFDRGVEAGFLAYSAEFDALDITLADVGDSSINGNPVTGPIQFTAEYAHYAYVNGDTLFGDAPSYWAQYPTGGTLPQQLRHIITQKWFSMNGTQGFEAWTEWRRTGYPDFLVQSQTSLIGAGRFPNRFFYPDVEFSRNANFPGQALIYDRVWWDVN